MKKLVVLGGSFNPPTVGHFKLLASAVDSIGADMGIFLPASDNYVKRKMARARGVCFDGTERTNMLLAMCEGDERMTVDDYHLVATKKTYDYEAMEYLRDKYEADEVYFIVGGDKLSVLPKWHRAEEFFSNFGILISERGGVDVEKELSRGELFIKYKDSFTVFEAPEEINSISSSAVRSAFKKGNREEARNSVHPYVWDCLCEKYEE